MTTAALSIAVWALLLALIIADWVRERRTHR